MDSANVMAITKWANGFGECDGYHKMGDLRLALLNRRIVRMTDHVGCENTSDNN